MQPITSSEKFHFRRNDFVENVAESFANLKDEKDFLDVTLVSEDFKHIHLVSHFFYKSTIENICSFYFQHISTNKNK